MGKHTPGPWMAEPIYDGEEGCAVIATHDEHGLRSPTRGQVALLTTTAGASFESPGLCEANARLIAAAPDLLEALDELVSVFHQSGMYDDEVFSKARAAIAKATGEPE